MKHGRVQYANCLICPNYKNVLQIILKGNAKFSNVYFLDRKGSANKGGKDAGKGGDKGKGGKGAPAPEAEEEDQGPPPPLEVQISVHLHHWKTAMDSLKDEEERQKELQLKDSQ